MKGDASVCHASCFRISGRCTTMSTSAFSMECEMLLYYTRVPYEEKGDTRNRDASCIRSPCPKILGPMRSLSLTTLRIFLKSPSALALLPPPPVILDSGPTARHCPLPGLRAPRHLDISPRVRCHLDPGLRARHRLISDSEHTTVDLKHITYCPQA
jgi:hypothetical protein